MNQIFSFNRWLLLIGKHWSENRKKYMLGLLALTGIMIVWFVFNILMDPYGAMDESIQYGTYFVGLFIVGCLYGSMLFGELSSRPKGISYLSVPASHFEKTLTALLYGVVIFFLCYTLIFYVADFIMLKIANAVSYAYWEKHHSDGQAFSPRKIVNVFWGDERAGLVNINIFYLFLLSYFAIQSAFILGSVYFAKFSFIKTTIALIAVWLFIIVFIDKGLGAFVPHGGFSDGFSTYRLYSDGETDKIIRLPEWINTIVIFLLKYAFAPIFWIVTYFRLKEKEI
jgi:hypothetical protein